MRQSTLVAAIAAVLCLPTAASASPYSDFYVFGDSLFDTGNIEDGLRFTNRVGPDYENSPYGPVSPDLVAAGLGLDRATPSVDGGNNYAVGGNQTAQTLQSITAATTYDAPAGITFNSFFYDLERTGRDLDRGAVYLLDGGGNDLPALVPSDVSATNMVQAAQALRDRGAKYVVIANVPDFGLAPAGITIQDLASSLAASVNDQIREQVGASNILIFDTFGLLNEVAADPGSYGINVTSETFSYSCFTPDGATCTEGNAEAKIDGSNPDPDQFMFNDDRHPTTIGQQISADYLLSILLGAGEIALLPEMGLDDMQAHWRAARPIMRSNRWSNSTPVESYTVWGGLNGHNNERDTDYNDTGTNEITQYNMGLNYRFSDGLYLGGMLSRGDHTLDYDHSNSRSKMESLDFSLLTGFRGDRWFFEGALSYSDLDYHDLQRAFSLGPMLRRTEKGDTDGETLGIMGTAGYNLFSSDKSYRLGPLVGYEFVRAEVDSFAEKGSSATALRVAEQKIYTGIWNVGLFGDMQLGFCDCELYSEAVYQSYGRDDSIEPRVGLVSVPGNSAILPGYERDDDGFRWDLGLSASLSEALELNVGAGIVDTDNNDGVWYGGEISYSF